MKHLSHSYYPQRGFTLLEVALVMLVVGIVLTGMIHLLTIQNQYQAEQDELARLAQIKQALVGFASLHGRLPCPDTNEDGKENPNNPADDSKSCNLDGVGGANLGNDYNQQRRVAVGLLPYADLGVPRTNRYGHPYQYVVTLHYADTENRDTPRFRDPTPFPYKRKNQSSKVNTRCANAIKDFMRSTFTFCSRGGVRVIQKNANQTDVIQDEVPFAVISLGKEGERTTSAPQNIKYKVLSTPKNQNTNSANPSDAVFIRNRTVMTGDTTDKAFDHKVIWMSSSALAMAVFQSGMTF